MKISSNQSPTVCGTPPADMDQNTAPAQDTQAQQPPASTEQEVQLTKEKKSEMDLSGKLLANQLSTEAKASQGAPKTAAAQQVESAMDKEKANGKGTRDVIVAGAKADAGNVDVRGDGMRGEDRLKEVYKSATGYPLEKNQKYDRTGQPIVQLKDGKGPSSWCGVWATDIWKRAGCDCKWVAGQGPSDLKGKKLPVVATAGNTDKKLENVKPGDMIVINSYHADNPNQLKAKSTNHHALVTDAVYESGGAKVTCPPAEVPKDGKLVGFHTMNGNSPGVPNKDGSNPAIREAYVDLTKPDTYTDDKDGKQYTKKISGYYPAPVPKEA